MSIFAPSLPPAPPLTCTNNCVGFASDGFCDDGGPGSISAKCALGTDCHDCGDSWRHGTHLPQPSPGAIVDPEDAGPVPWWYWVDPHGDRHRGVSIEQHRRESMEGREGRV